MIKNAANVFKKARGRLKKVLSDKKLRKDIGEYAVTNIKGNIRKGKSIPNNEKFDELEESTIKARKYLVKYNPTHDLYGPKKSNLTFTGKYVDSIKYKTKKGKIVIEPTGNHKAYKTGKGSGKKSISNKKLGEYLAEKRPHIGRNEKMDKRILKMIKAHLRRNLRRS